MIKILIADDHAIVRSGLKQIVGETSDIIVTGEASNGHEALDKISKGDYDVIVMDISMPGPSGLDILKQIKREHTRIPVLILSIHPEDQYAVRFLKAGASGYLTKESAPDELIKAIRKAYDGGRYVSLSLSEKMAFDLRFDTEKPLHETLSDREYQVMIKIAQGKKVNDIAEELFLSEKTISTYRSRILQKMGMEKNEELVRYVLNHNLID